MSKKILVVLLAVILPFSVLTLTGCEETGSNNSSGRNDPGDDGGNDGNGDVEDGEGGTEDPVDVVDEIGEFESLVSWLSSSDLSGFVQDDAIGGSNGADNNWTNKVDGGFDGFAVGGDGTYYVNPTGDSVDSVFLCGKNYVASTCQGASNSRGTQMRLGWAYSSYAMLNGADSVAGDSAGGGSFTVFALVSRVNSNETPIIYNRDGNAAPSVGVYLGWRNDTTLRFSTQGRTGSNAVEYTVPAFSSAEMVLLTGVFSRTDGLSLYVNGELVATDATKTTGADLSSPIIPTLGYRQGQANYGVHLFEWIEVDEALDSEKLCIAFDQFAESFSAIDSACD